ncbi:MAG: FAD:protein FMN transferase [Actinomycetota bacterium]|nr:FAD:protein FMN transferase [Actinomycetota bacterium]
MGSGSGGYDGALRQLRLAADECDVSVPADPGVGADLDVQRMRHPDPPAGCVERSCHILDPRTGRAPVGLASVTVTGPGITLVDAYATAAYVMGARRAATGSKTWTATKPLR